MAGGEIISYDFSEIDRMIAYADSIPGKVGKMLQDIITELYTRLLQLIREKAPRKTGNYANSWNLDRVEVNGTNITAIVSSPEGLLFVMLEFMGRRPGKIKKRYKRSLHFTDKGGNDVFAAWVMHPGFAAKPHIRPALDQLADEMIGIIRKHIDLTFPGVFTFA